MKPDTILETLIGKIAQDEDCIAAKVKPETKMENYVDQIGRNFTLPPLASPLNYRGYLVSDGLNSAKWVKPLEFRFYFSVPHNVPECSASYEEIVEAWISYRMIRVFFDDETDRLYVLQPVLYDRDNGAFVFASVCYYFDEEAIGYITCSIN